MAIVKLLIFSLFACCSLANPAKKRNWLLEESNIEVNDKEHGKIQELEKIYFSKEYRLVSEGIERATQHPDVGLNTVCISFRIKLLAVGCSINILLN